MRRYKVTILPQAQRQLQRIEDYVAAQASPAIAKRFVTAIAKKCLALDRFPDRGTPRDDLRPGMRTIVYRRRVTIAYAVADEEVAVAGFFYGGTDVAAALREERLTPSS